jgi:hypothetical protein
VWAKKIRGKLHYFGPWSGPDGALQRYLDHQDTVNRQDCSQLWKKCLKLLTGTVLADDVALSTGYIGTK